MISKKVRLKCKKCGGLKFVGDQYHAFGTYYVDVTCVVCSDSVDIEVAKLEKLIEALEKGHVRDNKKTDTK